MIRPATRRSWNTCAAAGIIVGTVFLNRTAGAQTTNISPSASFDVKAVRVVKPPVIDGDVGDSEWDGATVVTSFIQYEPALWRRPIGKS